MSTRNANPFIKLVKNIIGEMENTNFFDQGWVHSKFSDSYNHEELPITDKNENGTDYPDHIYTTHSPGDYDYAETDPTTSSVYAVDDEHEGNKPNNMDYERGYGRQFAPWHLCFSVDSSTNWP